jgi:hypothetical protein
MQLTVELGQLHNSEYCTYFRTTADQRMYTYRSLEREVLLNAIPNHSKEFIYLFNATQRNRAE